jgi:hypothetical protein
MYAELITKGTDKTSKFECIYLCYVNMYICMLCKHVYVYVM